MTHAKDSLMDVRARIDDHLRAFLEEKRELLAGLSPESDDIAGAISDLTLRGGKRTRPQVLFAGLIAVRPDARLVDALDAGCSLELLQTYLLIHDDWMDRDDQRRGGPSAHAALARRYGDAHLGASVAILAGDLASSYAWELVVRAPFPERRLRDGLGAFARMHEEVVLGQHLDLVGTGDVARMHDLKTGSYTVRGPLAIGAVLGDSTPAQDAALLRFGAPVGLAFQLRDDILGTFGDPRATGKPSGNDLRVGKRTALVAETERLVPVSERAALVAVLGNARASDAEVEQAKALIEQCGARASVEGKLERLASDARASLVASERDGVLSSEGCALLATVVDAIAKRDR